jgi:hypothetical protein
MRFGIIALLVIVLKIDMVEKLHDMEGAAFEALITDEARSLWGSAAIANVLAPAQNTAIDTAISQIEEIHSLKDGWKGPNSLGPTECAIDDAKTFATMVLADSKIEPPHIGLATDARRIAARMAALPQ